jgi:hypothetical protein
MVGEKKESNMSTWSGWPQDCPPPAAVDANGTYFHLLKNNPPAGNDMKTYFEQGKGTSCVARALSVFVAEEKIRHFQGLFPRIGSYVAKLQLAPEHGKIKVPVREDGHTEWWPSPGLDRTSVITEIKP